MQAYNNSNEKKERKAKEKIKKKFFRIRKQNSFAATMLAVNLQRKKSRK